MTYQHKQFGFVSISAFVIAFLFLATLFWLDIVLPYFNLLLIAMTLFMLVLGVLFSSMNVTVDSEHLSWHFGFGFWKKSVELAQITSALAVKNRWWFGWGIKRIPNGWLYNVSGMEAVEVLLKNGCLFRLGTDEPVKLVQAIEQAKA